MKKKKKIILASSSKRRKDLLNQIGIENFQIITPKFNEENFGYNLPIDKKVLKFSYLKALSVKNLEEVNDSIIISGDTEVYRAGKVYSKCFSELQVRNYLSELSGRKHFVLGGICVINPDGQVSKKLVRTEVYFDKIPKSEFSNKLLIDEGIGKAGGYAIQGVAGKFVKKIRGSYTNVVGLCLNNLYKILSNIGLKN